MPPDPLIHYRRIPGTRRYLDPQNPTRTVSDRFVRNYRNSLSANQREAIRVESRQVAIRNRKYGGSVATTHQAKIQYEGGSYGSSDRARLAELYARLYQYKLQERSMIGIPEYADELEALRDPSGDYANVLVELGRRPANATYPVGTSPPGVSEGLYK